MESKNNLFTFTYKNKEYTMTAVADLPNGIIRKTRNIEDEFDKAYTIVELLLENDPETLKALDDMSVAEFTEIITQWTQGATLGE